MNKAISIAMLTFLACGQVQIVMSESVQAQTIQDRKAEADRLFNQGNQQFQISQFEAAFQSWQQALTIYREIKDRRGEGASLGNLGIAYDSLGNYDKAIEYQLQRLAIARELKDRLGEGRSLGNLGNAYDALGKYDKAIEFHLQALTVLQELRDRQGEGTVLGNLGTAYQNFGKSNKAIEFHLQSLAIAREIKDRRGEGQSLGNLGIAYQNLGKYDKAIEFHRQSLVILQELKDRQGEGSVLRNLGNAYRNLGKYDKAIEYQLQSLAIAREIKDRRSEGQSLGNLGNAYRSLGKYDKAIEVHLQSLAIDQEIKDRRGEGQSLGNLGITYSFLGKYDKAIEFHLRSLAIKREIKDRLGEGRSLGNLGISYYSLGKYDKAIEFHLQRLAIAQEIKDRLGEGQSLGNLGNTYDSLDKYDKAIEFHLRSLAIKREIKDRSGEMGGLNNLAVTYKKLNRDQEAMISYQQALTIAREIRDRSVEGLTLANIGNLSSKANHLELAIVFYKQSINVREAIRKDIRKLDKDIQQSYLETISSSYKRLADLLIQQDRIIEALQVLDLLKVQELEDYFKNIKGSDRSAQGVRLLETEKAISDKLLAVSFENSPQISSQLAKQIQQLPKSEINKVPDYLQKIPQGTALLYPLILGDRLEIILFSPNTIPISRTVKISQKELETLVIDFRAALIDAGSEDVQEPATQLYQLLIKPIEAELVQAKTTTILYAPDGILRYIPIAALYDGKQWLAEKYRISNLIAYSLFDFSAQPKNSPKILAGAFGGKAGEKKFGQTALPATIREVQAIANSFNNSVTLIEDQFSRQAIESKFKNHNILHLATHAEFNIGVPDNSFIIFGNGDKIRLNEITDWQIPNIDLIVLSACQTGVGKLGDGVEILGFGYQVQKAGAKQAIASLWKVDDAGTQALMSAFYGELQKGDVTVTEALRRAQIALIKSPQYNHPNYWSAFFAIGNGL
ncbi:MULTISPECIES: CHAT domain-containing protein [Pseudanabaena]|uniref:CHAT domain-containing protein n=1 Tax=Pseudanabaena TaxID=1152 RepID=UPI00247A3DAF|nr:MULTISPECIES: tetratricopeptide repeat protein [Pseudanabaena]MEA5486345.1 tetratricopeptide repeat protein [Pseudanabaena sp. CCNP1317]WGS71506.1 tetratricopeptide repeat protein [Pseudanabaena galeata CCNP1313]